MNQTLLSSFSTDEGEGVAGARFAPDEIRRRLARLTRAPIDDRGEEATPPARTRHIRLGGGAAQLSRDAHALATGPARPLILHVGGRARDGADFTFGARGGVPSDQLILRDEWLDAGVSTLEFANDRLDLPRGRPVALLIHLDAFTLAGVAEPSALGFLPNDFWPLYRAWLRRLDVATLGIYGLIPSLDAGGLTADFAARLAAAYLDV